MSELDNPLPWTAIRRCDWWFVPTSKPDQSIVVFRCPTCTSPRQLVHIVDKWGYVSPRVICSACDSVYELALLGWAHGPYNLMLPD